MSLSLFSGFLVFMVSGLSLCVKKKHVLSFVILLEGIFLGVFCMMCSLFVFGDPTWLLIFVVMGVCEAALGLAVVVFMVRSCGNDYVLGLSVYMC